jgi:hypothetical protein
MELGVGARGGLPWKEEIMAEDDGAVFNWRWSVSGANFEASGHLITSVRPNDEGFYQIASVHGQVNGVAIAGLVPTGTSVPGNEPYTVDNLVRLPSDGNAPQLTNDGFAFALTDGTFANPFYKTDGSPPQYLNFTSDPATKKTNEAPIRFSAAQDA